MSSSVHADNKKKHFLILGEDRTQGLGDIVMTAKQKYSINFTEHNQKLCLSFHYNGANSYLLITLNFINLKQNTLKLMQFHYI